MNKNIKMKRNVTFRDADMNSWEINIELRNEEVKRRNIETLEEYTSKYEVSVSGTGGYSCGQCDEHINPRTDGQKRLLEFWNKYHLNGMSAGTNRQNAYIRGEEYEKEYNSFVEIFSQYSVKFWDKMVENLSDILMKHYNIDIIAALRMVEVAEKYMNGNPFKYIIGIKDSLFSHGNGKQDLYVEYFFLAMHDLLNDRGYRYGSGWLGIPLPADIEKQINDICQQIEEEEEELTESLVPVFNMGAEDFEATDEIVQKVMELRECDEEEAKRFIALGMHLGCTFGDLNDTFEEDDADKCRYNANGIEYYIGTDDELEAIANDYIHNDGDYEYFWREAVAAQKTTDSLEDWLDEVLRMDGWASILNHWNGSSDSYMVAGECIEVCRT